MYDQIRENILFIMLYTVVTTMAMIASCYLLFRRGNAFAPDITPPVRLRRWTGFFFASIALNHVWYMPIFFLSSSEDILMNDLIGGLLDSMTVIPLAIVVLFAILQDRRRPLWPIVVIVAPLVIGKVWCVASRSYAILPILYGYGLLMCIGLIIYMVRATRQYGRWLRDNYADLEHKEVWQSFIVFAITLLVFGIYGIAGSEPTYLYAVQVGCAVLICYLLWRVETLSDLSIPANDTKEETVTTDNEEDKALSLSIRNNVGPLLKVHCEEAQLYLQYDITLSRLAREIGINRLYLTQYFSSQGMNYNAYINDLRINHFISLYREAVATHRPVIAQQLAFESGYRSYSTFSDAFRRKTNKSVTAWMLAEDEGLRQS